MLLPFWDSDNVYQVSRDHFSCKVHGFNQRNRFKCIFLAPCQCIVLFDQQTSPTPPLIVGVTDFVLCASLKLFTHRGFCNVYSGRDTHTLHLFSGAAFTEKVTLGFLDRWGQIGCALPLGCHATTLAHPACLLHLTSPKTPLLWQPDGVFINGTTMAHTLLYQLSLWLFVFTSQLWEKHNLSPETPDNHWTYS